MIWVSWVIAILLVLVFIVMVTKITVYIDLRHAKDNDYYRVTFMAWFKLIRYTYEIPVVKVQKDSKTLLVEEKSGAGENTNKDKWKDYSVEDGLNLLEDAKQFLEHVVGFHTIFQKFLNRVAVKNLKWHTRVGLGDAALSAILVGVVWSAKSGVVHLLDRYMRLKNPPTMTVVPVFQQMWSETIFQCIISFRLGQAILVGLRLVKHWRKIPRFYKPESESKAHSVKT
ncbi:hypothetical protein CHN50_12640 [Priestia aryabhattai]|nr:hypothetical protein CHN50_12640 [Priestia aryabhattai]